MILSWMLYVSAIGLLLALTAWVLEDVVRQRGWPVRGLWLGALLGSLFLPALALMQRPPEAPARPAARTSLETVELAPMPTEPTVWAEWTEPLTSAAMIPARRFDLDSWLLALWGIASLAFVLALMRSHRALTRRRGEWIRQTVDGRTVWVSEDTGPAVVGFLPGDVVLPRWLLRASTTERQMVLAHEEEHVRAHDPALLLGALVVSAVLPWHPALWWIGRRLRRAVEVDCDLRVLARGVDPRAYSRLLVRVTEHGTAHRLAVAALSESASFLERRIRLMLTSRSRPWLGRAAASVALAGGMITAACRIDRPEQAPNPVTGVAYAGGEAGSLGTPGDTAPAAARSPMVTGVDASDGATSAAPAPSSPPDAFKALVQRAIEEFHPNLLTTRAPGGRSNLYLLINALGEIERTSVDTEDRSGNCGAILRSGLGAPAAREKVEALGCMHFDAGVVGPDKIHVYWAALEAQPGMAGAAPTGPYLFAEIAQRERPSAGRLRGAIRRYHPDVLRGGLPPGKMLWFIVHPEGQVLHTDRGPVYGSSRIAEMELEKRFPGLDIGPILMSSNVRDRRGERIKVVWAIQKASGSAPDLRGALPAAHVSLPEDLDPQILAHCRAKARRAQPAYPVSIPDSVEVNVWGRGDTVLVAGAMDWRNSAGDAYRGAWTCDMIREENGKWRQWHFGIEPATRVAAGG